MKISAGLLGVALGQGSGDSDDYTYTYDSVDADAGAAEKSDGYNNGYNSGYNFNQASYSSDPYNQGYYGRAAVGAYELSCWNSNSMRDFNHDNKFAAPGDTEIGSTVGGLHHQYGYENGNYAPGTKFDSTTMEYGSDTNLYGSIETGNHIDIADDTHAVDAVSPHKWGYQNSNPDAKYHYGHHVLNADSNRGYGPQASTAYHGFVADDWRYSLRHSGCLYEIKDYTYDATSYDVTSTLAWTAGSSTAHPHWVHVFNAHIYPHSANTIKTFHVVMANPVYEGLGYFNFVATYADTEVDTAIDSFAQDPFASTYDKAARYSVAKGSWALTENTSISWKLSTAAAASAPAFAAAGKVAGGVAISSFPHNQLGADFRFNLRTLHNMGHGLQDAKASNPADSYFWYAVDTIVITFPHFVSATDSCHGIRSGHVADPDTVDCTHHVHDIVDENIEITSDTGGNQGSPTARLGATITEGCTSNYGPDGSDNYQCAWFCKNGEITCGKILTISNIMSTYDEFHLRQYGTIQEIWAQLQYAYTQTVDKDSAVPTGFESPMPNVFFSAAQLTSIVLSCSGEKCSGYTRAQNMPYAGDSTEGNRWTNDVAVISNGDARGDAFWVNNNDN